MIPPGARRIDPDAETARLAEARKQATEAAGWPVACDEIFPVQLPGCQETFMYVHVATRDGTPLPADLGARLANVIRALWPKAGPS